ncbi:MAG: hypothetical protein J2P31_14420, partial [Blastocatellia bacterium]|nr:hypothetical protein [Blastocatellia bacterium]
MESQTSGGGANGPEALSPACPRTAPIAALKADVIIVSEVPTVDWSISRLRLARSRVTPSSL